MSRTGIELVVNLRKEDGNAFCILGNVVRIMRGYGCKDEEVMDYLKRAKESDYNNLLKVSGEMVDLKLVE